MKILSILILAIAMIFSTIPKANASPIGMQPFHQVIYISGHVNATNGAAHTGTDYNNAKSFFDQQVLWSIPAGTVIQGMYMIVDEALTGTSALTIGDGSSATGYITAITGTGSLGLQYYGAGLKGSYLQGAVGNISSALPAAKYYSAAGSLLLSVTGAATAGKIRLVVYGYSL